MALLVGIFILLLVAPAVHVTVSKKVSTIASFDALIISYICFLSIDCGLDDKYGGYTTLDNGLYYVPDGPYVDSGENHQVDAEHQRSSQRRFGTVRSFPSGVRNCYSLPTEAGAKHLVRLMMYYGNYDGRNGSASLEFDLHLGANYWATARVGDEQVYEALFVAWAAWAPVCLVNTGRGVPFVSTVELRKLPGALYPPVTGSQALYMFSRNNMGNSSASRLSNDTYDRWWTRCDGSEQWMDISTSLTIQPDPNFVEPLFVLQAAITAARNGSTLTYLWNSRARELFFTVFLHFADFQNTQTRQFDIYLNGDRRGLSEKPYSPPYLAASCVYNSEWYKVNDGNYNITLVSIAISTVSPMVNAIEIYTNLTLDGPTTSPKDFDAIMAIKFEYGVKKNWNGDPCFPIQFTWDGVKCSNTSDGTMRITSIDLSNSSLHGVISKNFTLLTALENLDLSYNNLGGTIPDSLPSLPALRVLNLSGNYLSGESLCKNYTGSLVFRYYSGEDVCSGPPSSPGNKAAIIAVSVVVPVLVVVVLFLAYFIWRNKRKFDVSTHERARHPHLRNALRNRKTHGADQLQNAESRWFTYKELEKFTNKFHRILGQGGFGLVYYGRLDDDTEVAVKMRSESSSHGLQEFFAEIQSLTKVHHRNLVSLLGYCWEKDHLALVYEYMSQGDLGDHLRGKNGVAALPWGARVRVVLEAAQGLDYLHKGCNLPIIHRDVKTSNILLGQNLKAKISDFGLSKTYLSDTQTHISATAAGSAGYIDPEHYLTGRLTESSDVYSFGVVLLEVTTGESPIVPGDGHITQRVKEKIATGDIGAVVNPRLGSAYDSNSVWKVVETAMMCTADSAAQRPTMSSVVSQLKECLALEEAREEDSNTRVSRGNDAAAMDYSTSRPSQR